MKKSVSLIICFLCVQLLALGYELNEHPRIFITRAQLPVLAQNANGILNDEYKQIKQAASQVVNQGQPKITNRFATPNGLISCGISYLVERELGNDAEKYAEAIKKYWGDGEVLGLEGDGFFGFHGILYDWIFDALTERERKLYGDQLGQWLRYYTKTPEILLMNGHWWYNQTWAPAHLNTPNTRDGITPKLMVAIALKDAGTIQDR